VNPFASLWACLRASEGDISGSWGSKLPVPSAPFLLQAFRSLNNPLRETSADRRPHKLPVTINLIKGATARALLEPPSPPAPELPGSGVGFPCSCKACASSSAQLCPLPSPAAPPAFLCTEAISQLRAVEAVGANCYLVAHPLSTSRDPPPPSFASGASAGCVNSAGHEYLVVNNFFSS